MVSESLWKQVKTADVFTLLNGIFGFSAILASFQGNFPLGTAFILFAVIFDYLDGKIARLSKKASSLGKELDSLADIISFGVAPAFLVYALYPSWPVLVGGMLLLVAGMLRLARYNVREDAPAEQGEVNSHFIGMPITMNGFIFPLAVYLGLSPAFFPYLLLLSALLMVSSVRFRRFIH
ncbi:MAG: CDP-diacylglycerol--serine O-phosphatidyltransferase [DPANN group archaeon]|nr:CDP-diacylglycerol--serine O-phosphatidyltransferase [DPANN group archaeon]